MTTAASYPIGATLDGGAIAITERLRGTRDKGLYRARATTPDGQRLLVAIGTRQTRPLAELAAALALPYKGVAPLRHVGPVEGGRHDALVEVEPDGAPLDPARPPPRAAVLSIGVQLTALLETIHRGGRTLGALHAEQIYAVPSQSFGPIVVGVAPRAERFLASASPVDYGLPPLFDALYLSPEELEGRPPTAASDVFSLACLIAHLATGAHPFAGHPGGQLVAILHGDRGPLPGGGPLEPLIDAALALEPRRRLSLAELTAGLERLAAG